MTDKHSAFVVICYLSFLLIISCLTVVLMDSAEGSQRTGVASRALTVFGLPNSPGN
jgi:hypothetical protein